MTRDPCPKCSGETHDLDDIAWCVTCSGGSLLDRLMEKVEQHQRDVWTQTREGQYSAWRALLARDVADVERYCQELDDCYDDDPIVLAHMPTCAAWLTRARAVL